MKWITLTFLFVLSAIRINAQSDQSKRPNDQRLDVVMRLLEGLHSEQPDSANYLAAIHKYTASMKDAEKAGDSLSVSFSLSNIAGVFASQREFELAEQTYLRCLRIRQELKDSVSIATTYSDLGNLMTAKGDYKKAIEYLKLSNGIAEAIGYTDLQSSNYSDLSEAARQDHDYQKAFVYFSRRSALRDSLSTLEKNKAIQQLNSQYESSRKEQQIFNQRNRLRLQNYLFIGIAGLILLAVLLLYSFYKRYRLRKETQLQAEIMKQQEIKTKAVMEAEENERQRIAQDLHDGIGQMMSAAKMNLSAFESEMKFEDPEQKKNFEKIIHLVDESCKEVRTVSHLMMPGALLKSSLASAIRDFVNKLNTRSVRIHVSTTGLDEKSDSHVETMLYRVVQECVHNAIKHASATTLDISLIKDKDGISGTIEDNGKGFDPSDPDRFEGIGLKNITTRIAYLKGTVDFDSGPGRGTVISFHVPLDNQ